MSTTTRLATATFEDAAPWMAAPRTAPIRVVKRYESRKLYDVEESRYVGLDEIGAWVREGQEVRVIDNAAGEDVTSQVLTLVILEEGRRGRSLPTELLHDLVRAGADAVAGSVEEARGRAESALRASLDRFAPAPVKRLRDEMGQLRGRLDQLEAALAALDAAPRR